MVATTASHGDGVTAWQRLTGSAIIRPMDRSRMKARASAASTTPGARRSALIAPVPEAEPLIGPLRGRYDPTAAKGVPAHATVVFPFLAPRAIDAHVLEVLAHVFAGVDAFTVVWKSLSTFPGGIWYLAPSSSDELVT